MNLKESQAIKALANDYVTWQERIEVLEAERPRIHARLMELQQAMMEDKGDPPTLQAAKAELQNLDEKLEAGAAKLTEIWGQMEATVIAEIDARLLALPETKAALEKEYREKCKRGGQLLADAMAMLEDLGIPKEELAKILDLPGAGNGVFAFAGSANTLMDAYSKARRPALTPRDPDFDKSYIQKKSNLENFWVLTSNLILRNNMVRQKVNKAILTAGG